MATISKFYLLDAATPNTGTMPTGAFLNAHSGAGTDAAGAATARDATDVPGTSNPDLEATATAAAVVTTQNLNLRRFVSRPLAARTFAAANGNWTWDYAAFESNTNHAGGNILDIYCWRPSTGARVGTGQCSFSLAAPTTTAEAHYNAATAWGLSVTIADGDILVFEVSDFFTQTMSSAYTTSFSYNGTTDASITTAASFVTPPVALTLLGGAAATLQPKPMVISQAVQRAASRCWSKRPSGIFVPRLWTPEAA